jgi:hypothetical protein
VVSAAGLRVIAAASLPVLPVLVLVLVLAPVVGVFGRRRRIGSRRWVCVECSLGGSRLVVCRR